MDVFYAIYAVYIMHIALHSISETVEVDLYERYIGDFDGF